MPTRFVLTLAHADSALHYKLGLGLLALGVAGDEAHRGQRAGARALLFGAGLLPDLAELRAATRRGWPGWPTIR